MKYMEAFLKRYMFLCLSSLEFFILFLGEKEASGVLFMFLYWKMSDNETKKEMMEGHA